MIKLSAQAKQTLTAGLISGFGAQALAFPLGRLMRIIPISLPPVSIASFGISTSSVMVASCVHDYVLQANPFHIASDETRSLVAKSAAVLSAGMTAIAVGSFTSLSSTQALTILVLGFTVYRISQALFSIMDKGNSGNLTALTPMQQVKPTLSEDDLLRQEIVNGLCEAHQFGKRNISGAKLQGMWYKDHRQYQDRFPDLANHAEFQDYLERMGGYVSSEYFNQERDYIWYLLEGKNASTALTAVLTGPSFLECMTGAQVYYFHAIKSILGEAKFNRLFGASDQDCLCLRLSISNWSAFTCTSIFESTESAQSGVMGEENNRPLAIGDWCYFEGVEDYDNRHGKGNGYGANVIYIGRNTQGEQLYMGFDFDEPVTEKQIAQKLIDIYCLPRIGTFSFNEHGAALSDQGQFQIKGFDPSGTKRLRLDVLKQLRSQELTKELIERCGLR